jgi:hypothetical protein
MFFALTFEEPLVFRGSFILILSPEGVGKMQTGLRETTFSSDGFATP